NPATDIAGLGFKTVYVPGECGHEQHRSDKDLSSRDVPASPFAEDQGSGSGEQTEDSACDMDWEQRRIDHGRWFLVPVDTRDDAGEFRRPELRYKVQDWRLE